MDEVLPRRALAEPFSQQMTLEQFHWIVCPQIDPLIELDVTRPLLSFAETLAVTLNEQLPVGNCPA